MLGNEDRNRFERYARELAQVGDVTRLDRIASLVDTDDRFGSVLRARDGARGTIDAYVVIRLVPHSVAELLLPMDLELAPHPLATDGRHPVFYMFAAEKLDRWLGDTDFHSFTLGVPYVQHSDPSVPHRGPFIYRTRQYVDDGLARSIGKRVYGFERIGAHFDVEHNAYKLRERIGREMLLDAAFEKRGPPRKPTSMARFEDVRQLFDQPTISQSMRIVDREAFRRRPGGPFFACINRYLFDADDAVLTPARALIRVGEDVTPGAFPRDRVLSPALDEAELGAFHIRVRQELSLPTQSLTLRFPEAPPQRRKRVVVLGTGPAACAATYYLAKTGRYDITMYALGYRMGGKCAAGRNPDRGMRIEEHGLHAFLGFYNNAFRTVREVYETAGLPLAKGEGPWSPERLRAGEGPVAEGWDGTDTVGLMGQWRDAHGEVHWRHYPTGTGINEGVPGVVPFESRGPSGFARVILVTLGQALRQARQLRGAELLHRRRDVDGDFLVRLFDRLVEALNPDEDEDYDTVDFLECVQRYFERVAFEELADAVARGSRLMTRLAEIFHLIRRRARRDFAADILEEPAKWFQWCGLEMMVTTAIGLITDKVIDLDDIDHWDLIAWLEHHGIDPEAVRSPMVLYLYDSSFATSTTEPVQLDNLAAGVGLRWFFLLLDYQGFPAYEFRYSCPQSLVTPYYKALSELGVEVRFFHKVEKLEVQKIGGERRLVGVRLRRQATVKAGPGKYNPLWMDPIPGNPPELRPWPTRPDYEQLVEGEHLVRYNLEDAWGGWPGVADVELRQGQDFDLCICGMSLGALPPVVGDLIEPSSPAFSERWAKMIETMGLCRTVSMQLWMERTEEQLYGPDDENEDVPEQLGLITQFASPEGSFGNLTHLLRWERWSDAAQIVTPPAYLAYHTGAWASGTAADVPPYTDFGHAQRVQAQWREEARQWLETHYRGLYNRAPEPFEEFCNQLVAPPELKGVERLEYQWFNVGVQPWDMYVLSVPGSMRHRLGQAESDCKYLFLCGDWTRTDLNVGCVEAATQSGMLCARAISNHPRYVWHAGF